MAAETNISELRVLPGIDSALHRCTMRNWHVWSILCDVYSRVGWRRCEFGAFRVYSSSLFSQKQIFVMINREKKSGFISFLSVISYIKVSQSKKNASLRQRYQTQPVIHKGWKSNEVEKKIQFNVTSKKSKTNENCLQLASRSQHPFRGEKVCH